MTKIMLVEDDKSLREIYGVRLLAEGYDIVSAGDGEKALAMAIKERPQLIISDVMMPKISGFDMLDILRSTTETRGIKVIMMTALSSEDQRTRGEQLGADRYLVKSQVGIEDVVRVVHEVLGDAPTIAKPAAPVSSATTVAATPLTARPAPPQPGPSKPQPGAPRPASLGERVIQPLANNPRSDDSNMGALLDRELAGHTAATPAAPPPQSPATPQPPATTGDINADLDKILTGSQPPAPSGPAPTRPPAPRGDAPLTPPSR
jgi:CheY-like chemotaxis protein